MSSRGTDYVILNRASDEITVDGYLVAWQYFTRSGGTPCPSYAAVWRRPGDDEYRFQLIQYTLLPNQGLDSVNFFFNTNQVARVKQGDCPSIFVNKDAQPNCSGNLVTFGSGSGSGLFGTHDKLRGFDTPNFTFVAESTNTQGRTLSIRPFVAGEFADKF